MDLQNQASPALIKVIKGPGILFLRHYRHDPESLMKSGRDFENLKRSGQAFLRFFRLGPGIVSIGRRQIPPMMQTTLRGQVTSNWLNVTRVMPLSLSGSVQMSMFARPVNVACRASRTAASWMAVR